MPESAAQTYLRSMLEINPVWQSASALQLRRKTLRLPNHDPRQTDADSVDDMVAKHQRRAQARETVAHLQKQFFHLSDEELESGITSVNATEVPELAPTIRRLQTAARERNSFVAMLADQRFDRELVIALGKSVVLPQSDAGYIREKFIQNLTTKSSRKRARDTSLKIQKSYPNLFGLERDWLTTLQNTKASGPMIAGESSLLNFRVLFFGTLIAYQIVKIFLME
ncbi:hypothetical protein [Rhodopirellula sp. P2]|uniref:hypothetical protein n=1 Tax=Rhodopirellula sp. P2 TaxID=2127060 RepID=UPI002368D6FB|nr:hypothetical protein [Rhodopirellula sp. P2]WDQ15675.1 hypothetical protein PSR62_18775 [Rhodopirellula sp. P2]